MLGTNSSFLAGRQQLFSVAVMTKLSAHSYLGAQSGGLYSMVGSFPSRSFPKAFAEDCLPLVGKDKQPDVLWMPNQIDELPLQIQQARAMGITSTFLGGDSWDVTTLAETAGADMVEGACYVSCFSAENDSEAAKAWVEAFEEINGYTPGSHATLAYEALKIVINGLESIETFSREALLLLYIIIWQPHGLFGGREFKFLHLETIPATQSKLGSMIRSKVASMRKKKVAP